MDRSLLILFWLLSLNVSGTNYYINYSTGNDANTGTSEVQAWKNVSKLNAVNPSAGDSIFLNRGDTWREQIKFQNDDGNTNTNIYIGTYGTGAKPRLYGSKDGDQEGYWTSLGSNKWASANSSFTYETFMIMYDTNVDTAYCTRRTTEEALTTNWDFWYDLTNDRVVMYHSVGSPNLQADGIEICGIYNSDNTGNIFYLQWSDYWTIENIEFRYSNKRGITMSSCDGVNIVGCDFSFCYDKTISITGGVGNVIDGVNIYDGGYVRPTTGTGGEAIWMATDTNTVIRNSEVSYCRGVFVNGWNSVGALVHDNYVHDINDPPAVIKEVGIYFDGCKNITVRNNKVESIPYGYAVNAEVIGMAGNNNKFHNNVSINNAIGFNVTARSDGKATTTDTYIYNNTIISNLTGDMYTYDAIQLRYTTGVEIKNNIFYNRAVDDKFVFLFYGTAYNIDCDYNLFYFADPFHIYKGASYASLATWQAGTGFDLNSVEGNPLFNNFGVGDYTLSIGSPAIDAGVYVGLLYRGEAPDIGAFEYGIDEITPPIFARNKTGKFMKDKNGKLMMIIQ